MSERRSCTTVIIRNCADCPFGLRKGRLHIRYRCTRIGRDTESEIGTHGPNEQLRVGAIPSWCEFEKDPKGPGRLFEEYHAVPIEPGKRARDIECPQCKKPFRLCYDEEMEWREKTYRVANPESLYIRACPSGGIYGVSIICPHCRYEEEL